MPKDTCTTMFVAVKFVMAPNNHMSSIKETHNFQYGHTKKFYTPVTMRELELCAGNESWYNDEQKKASKKEYVGHQIREP